MFEAPRWRYECYNTLAMVYDWVSDDGNTAHVFLRARYSDIAMASALRRRRLGY